MYPNDENHFSSILTTAEPTATPAAVVAIWANRPGCFGWAAAAGAAMGGGGGGAARAGSAAGAGLGGPLLNDLQKIKTQDTALT